MERSESAEERRYRWRSRIVLGLFAVYVLAALVVNLWPVYVPEPSDVPNFFYEPWMNVPCHELGWPFVAIRMFDRGHEDDVGPPFTLHLMGTVLSMPGQWHISLLDLAANVFVWAIIPVAYLLITQVFFWRPDPELARRLREAAGG
ncbi:MAG: hypothetical protein JXO22_01895 [Phycisphaerae bacterium]|nr:hypothetical protein [Phycisphaerae bacterium]